MLTLDEVQFPRRPLLETVRKVAETVSGRGVIADIDTEIGLLRPFFSILGLHGSKLLKLFGQSL